MKPLITLTLLVFSFHISQAQIFGRVLDKAMDRAVDKIEDKLADEIANAAYRSIDRKIEEAFRKQYEQDSINGKTSADYGGYMAALMRDVPIRDNYSFGLSQEFEITDHKNEKYLATLYYTEDAKYFGVYQPKEKSTLIMDIDNDAMILFDHEESTITGLPSFMNLAVKMQEKDTDEDFVPIVKKTGKTKKIAGYESDEYEVETDKLKGKAWITDKLPYGWTTDYAALSQKFMPKNKYPSDKGIPMMSDMKEKNKKKRRYRTKTLSLTLGEKIFDTSSYQKISYSNKE